MDIEVTLPGGAQVDAHFNGMVVTTHQDGSAPTPFQLFLASLGTCAGIYVAGFCQQRGLPTENIRIIQRMTRNPVTHMIDQVELDIQLPPDFPEQYKAAVIRSAELCAVKKHIENPPQFNVHTSVVEPTLEV